jgi:hypothetical protein
MKSNKEFIHVFVIKKAEAISIIKDEVIEIYDNRYKSIKFRHTYYDRSDFLISIEEVKAYLAEHYKYTGTLEYLISES